MLNWSIPLVATMGALALLTAGCSSTDEEQRGAQENASEEVIGADPNAIATASPSTSSSSSNKKKSSSDSGDNDEDDDDDGDITTNDLDDVAEDFDDIAADDILDIAGVGFYPDNIIDCGATYSATPIIVTNTTSSVQTYSVTVNKQLANQLAFFPDWTNMPESADSGCSDIYSGQASSQSVTVQPGETAVSGIGAGGGQWNDLENNHNVAIGAGGSAWYDFWLHEGAKGGFKNLELNYSGTGGTNSSQNVQSGLFNVMECAEVKKGAETYYAVTNEIISGYTDNNANAWTFNQNEPICFGFLDTDSSTPYPTAS